MPAAYNKFNAFSEALAEKVHNLGSDTYQLALTNTLPTAANAALADITEISYTNLSSRSVGVATSSTQTAGTYKLVLPDLTLTASGAVASFRYVVLYNATATGNVLIAWWDYGVSIGMNTSETFLVDFDALAGVLQFT